MREKIIICSGDSYTFGEETAGDLLVKGYSNNLVPIRHPLPPDAKTKSLKLRKKLNNPSNRTKYNEECLKNSWPSQLSKKTNAEVINVAAGGLSNHEIFHRCYKTYLKYLSSGVKAQDILIICMLSSPNRIGYPQYSNFYSNEFYFQSFMPYSRQVDKMRSYAVKDWYSTHKDWDMLWSTYCITQGFINFIKFYGSRFFILDSGLLQMFIRESQFTIPEHNYVNDLINLIEIQLCMTDELHINKPLVKLPQSHCNTYGHIIFAEKVYELIN